VIAGSAQTGHVDEPSAENSSTEVVLDDDIPEEDLPKLCKLQEAAEVLTESPLPLQRDALLQVLVECCPVSWREALILFLGAPLPGMNPWIFTPAFVLFHADIFASSDRATAA
jgi:hypothetical protein